MVVTVKDSVILHSTLVGLLNGKEGFVYGVKQIPSIIYEGEMQEVYFCKFCNVMQNGGDKSSHLIMCPVKILCKDFVNESFLGVEKQDILDDATRAQSEYYDMMAKTEDYFPESARIN